jgi:hypothetical protein
MRRALTLHPDSHCIAVTGVEIEIALPRPGRLVLQYCLTGRMSDLLMPPVTASARADGLWEHTCFEAFVRAPPATSYYEFNFAPSTQWAAYRFADYRDGMSAVDFASPQLSVQSDSGSHRLQAVLDLGKLSDLANEAAWQLGLSAVIEEKNGRKSYWALAHPPGDPDFHHSDGFGHEFSAMVRT